jgi:anti-sigma factor ChrR (cupin superfamily)
MNATATLRIDFPTVQIPAAIGAKTWMLSAGVAGVNVSVARTNTTYYAVVARVGMRTMSTVHVSVHKAASNPAVWEGTYYDENGELVSIGMTADLGEMLAAAMRVVVWRGQDLSQW